MMNSLPYQEIPDISFQAFLHCIALLNFIQQLFILFLDESLLQISQEPSSLKYLFLCKVPCFTQKDFIITEILFFYKENIIYPYTF